MKRSTYRQKHNDFSEFYKDSICKAELARIALGNTDFGERLANITVTSKIDEVKSILTHVNQMQVSLTKARKWLKKIDKLESTHG